MEIQHFHFIYPKRESLPSECEDGISISLQKRRFCVTDGASCAFDSRSWARILAAGWKIHAKGVPFQTEQFSEEIELLAQRWKRKWSSKELPWYAEAKLRSGSAAAFLGVEFDPAENGLIWRAYAVGDCCLFVISSQGQLLRSFPLVEASQFGSNPILISTNDPVTSVQQVRIQEGVVSAQESVLIMSDAISAWFIRSEREAALAFMAILKTRERNRLSEWIDSERGQGNLKNDDVAIIYLEFTDNHVAHSA